MLWRDRANTDYENDLGHSGEYPFTRGVQGPENSAAYIIDAVRSYATLGEIIGVMKETFGII